MKRPMKKRTEPSSSVAGQASLDFIMRHIIEVVQATSQRKPSRAQRRAARILSQCLVNRYAEDHPSPFGELSESDVVLQASQLWLSGDLAIGRGGAEFMYVYSPTDFVEDLLAEALKITSAPIKASAGGRAIPFEERISTSAKLVER
jgi:hypothetical protein